MDDLIKQVKKALRAKGYRIPRPFRDEEARGKFIAEYGYDPNILVRSTMRMMDASGAGWEEQIRPYQKPPAQEDVRKTKAQERLEQEAARH